jgi:CheY-like chemotaxis protein
MKRVVIVEDDLIIQELQKHYIERIGHEVKAAFTKGSDAIRYFQEGNHADLILMDIRLEDDEDGIDSITAIQEICHIPVVYITANTEERELRRALSTSMRGFLSKPLATSELENIIESLNDVTDSMIYAERIQRAIFAQRDSFESAFKEIVYINRPKDVISGDFPIFIQRADFKDVILGVADCTGHGIPAALLSVLSHEIINNACRTNENLVEIVLDVNANLIRNLVGSKDNSVHDSLDLSLVRIIPGSNTLECTGIKRPIVYFNSENQEFEYFSFRGQHLGSADLCDQDISVVKIPCQRNDVVFQFSDGLTDQFGGVNNKKIMKKRILKVLDEFKNETLPRMQVSLDLVLRRWQGGLVQTDDIMVIGIKPSLYNLS